MMKILLVEDSSIDQALVSRTLSSKDVEVRVSSSASAAFESLRTDKYDLVLLDLGLPDGSGFQVLSRMQANVDLDQVPVILLTGEQDVNSKVNAFELGADDYLVKPVSPQELRARVDAKLRRKERIQNARDGISRGPLKLRLSSQSAELQEEGSTRALDLTPKEFKLLYRLASSEGAVVRREDLLNAVWGKQVHIGDRTVDTHICSLRKKLAPHSSLIESVPGAGYRFTLQNSRSGHC